MQDRSCILSVNLTCPGYTEPAPTAGLLTSAPLSKQTRFPVTPRGQLVQIPLQPATKGPHCLSARTIYTFGDTKYSEFSKPTCFPLEAPSRYKVAQK